MGYGSPEGNIDHAIRELQHLRKSWEMSVRGLPEAVQHSFGWRSDELEQNVQRLASDLQEWRSAAVNANVPFAVPDGYENRGWFPLNGHPVWVLHLISPSPVSGQDDENAPVIDLYSGEGKADDYQFRLLREAAEAVAEDAGYRRFQLVDERRGSIYQRWSGRLKKGASSRTVRRHAAEIDQTLSAFLNGERQAKLDNLHVQNLAGLIQRVETQTTVFARAGSAMVVKWIDPSGTPVMYAANLSPIELRAIELNPGIALNPSNALNLLSLAVYELGAGSDSDN